MKTLVMFYSYSGNTKRLALSIAQKEAADLVEIEDLKRPSPLAAFFRGCPKARRQKPSPIKPVSVNLDAYDKLIVMAPIWAGFPAPPINNVYHMLPPGKEVALIMVSASGTSSKKKVLARWSGKDTASLTYTDITPPKK